MYSTEPWRFLDTGAADGAFNMAVDEGLARAGNSPLPILRVYRWQPFTISIGYLQESAEVDAQTCRRDGVGLVRRPTGGRAIFHAHEVTYSVIIPKGHGWFAKSSLLVYNEISAALALGLQSVGLPVKLEKRSQPDADFAGYRRQFACFASSARFEIHYQSRKLVGSAQRRFENALLQHGSILLGDQHLRLVDYLARHKNGELEAARQQLQNKTTTIEAILNREVSYDEIARCVKSGFETSLNINFKALPLTAAELDIINQLKSNYTDLRRRL